ncbi:hypothetical protein, partial [Staphylococcus simulans]
LEFIFLMMMKAVLAITMFEIGLIISLMMFNVLFSDRTGMKIVINLSFKIVMCVIIAAYFMLREEKYIRGSQNE